MESPALAREARLSAHEAVSTALARYDDRALHALVTGAEPAGSGIGGTSALTEVAGSRVFVKRVPLTRTELRPEHIRSTANLFGLPMFCHYGVGALGGPGFGAWRELAAHLMTTDWVRTAEHDGFPLLHHWRVLPDTAPLPGELSDIERAVAYWGGAPEVRGRIEALSRSPATLTLVLEHIPRNLHEWLGREVEAGGERADRACALVERDLPAGIAFMNDRGLLHFDAHFENILTDGHRLYFADYGLALSSAFDLAPDEADFLDRHRTYDHGYTASYLVNWLVTALCGIRREDHEGRRALIHALARGKPPEALPKTAATLLTRHAPIAAVMSDFTHAFRTRTRRVPYPLEEIRRLGLP